MKSDEYATHMVIINMAVMNISINRPRATLTPGANEVRTLRVPGVRASMRAAPVIMVLAT